MEPRARIGIDLGGTKIAGVLLERDGEVVDQARVDAPRGHYRETVAAVCTLARTLVSSAQGMPSVGIGIPGSISPLTGRVQNANSTWLNGQPLKQDIEAVLGHPVRIANDANCFALSEAADGAGRGEASVFGVILGTGCGGGLIAHGHIIDGPRGIGGEWGHNPLPWPEPDETPGPSCWCGRKGCMETWVSGPGLARDHAQTWGETLAAEEIVLHARNSCTKARQTLRRHASRLARGLAHVVNVFDPGVIILGGGLSNMTHLYDELPGLMTPHIFSEDTSVRIRPPEHGAESGARGAAWLWGSPADSTDQNV